MTKTKKKYSITDYFDDYDRIADTIEADNPKQIEDKKGFDSAYDNYFQGSKGEKLFKKQTWEVYENKYLRPISFTQKGKKIEETQIRRFQKEIESKLGREEKPTFTKNIYRDNKGRFVKIKKYVRKN